MNIKERLAAGKWQGGGRGAARGGGREQWHCSVAIISSRDRIRQGGMES